MRNQHNTLRINNLQKMTDNDKDNFYREMIKRRLNDELPFGAN